MTVEEWLAAGQAAGFCSEIYCAMHDMPPDPDGTDAEADWDDPCQYSVRLLK